MMPKKPTGGTLYRIVLRSELGDRYASAFEGMRIETKGADTILTAEIIDQPQLHGILGRIGTLGLELLSVQVLPEEAHPSAERPESRSDERGGEY
jgi:hypothetical protein